MKNARRVSARLFEKRSAEVSRNVNPRISIWSRGIGDATARKLCSSCSSSLVTSMQCWLARVSVSNSAATESRRARGDSLSLKKKKRPFAIYRGLGADRWRETLLFSIDCLIVAPLKKIESASVKGMKSSKNFIFDDLHLTFMKWISYDNIYK